MAFGARWTPRCQNMRDGPRRILLVSSLALTVFSALYAVITSVAQLVDLRMNASQVSEAKNVVA